MSKHYTHNQSSVMHDIQCMSSEELEQMYGIEIDATDGSVWDPCENRVFEDLNAWGQYMQEQEEEDDFDYNRPPSRRRSDDDY